jgi:hypothetical protein
MRSLSLANKRNLLRWLQTQIEKEEKQNRASAAQLLSPGRQIIQEQGIGKIVYRQERIRCGKSGCNGWGTARAVLVQLLPRGWKSAIAVYWQNFKD